MDVQFQDASPTIAHPLGPAPPPWVTELLRDSPASRFALTSTSIANATALNRAALIERVAAAYRALLGELAARGRHAVRIWNFVSDVHGKRDFGDDRYMAFNAGGFAAFSEAFRITDGDYRAVPTASAISVGGTTLWVYIPSAEQRGLPVENPRQTPSYRYSSRYGVRPPCFARATRLDEMLFIGGTASIIDEDSYHAPDIDGQIDETLCNLRALVAAATGAPEAEVMGRIRNLRVHLTDRADVRAIREAIDRVLAADAETEFVKADLCRKELLVEIEGVADCT